MSDPLGPHVQGEAEKSAMTVLSAILSRPSGLQGMTSVVAKLHPRTRAKLCKAVLDGCTADIGAEWDEFVRDLSNERLTKLLICCLMFARGRLSDLQLSAAIGYPRPPGWSAGPSSGISGSP